MPKLWISTFMQQKRYVSHFQLLSAVDKYSKPRACANDSQLIRLFVSHLERKLNYCFIRIEIEVKGHRDSQRSSFQHFQPTSIERFEQWAVSVDSSAAGLLLVWTAFCKLIVPNNLAFITSVTNQVGTSLGHSR